MYIEHPEYSWGRFWNEVISGRWAILVTITPPGGPPNRAGKTVVALFVMAETLIVREASACSWLSLCCWSISTLPLFETCWS
jgi:hypothetical protein